MPSNSEQGNGIPSFLIISAEDRRKAWEDFRARKILPPEVKHHLPIGDLPDVRTRSEDT